MGRFNTEITTQHHHYETVAEYMASEFENKSTFEMLEEWAGKSSGELTEEDKARINTYYHKAPEIEPDNLYGTKYTTSVWYEYY